MSGKGVFRNFGKYGSRAKPYQRSMSKREVDKMDATETKLARLDGRFKLWVRKTPDLSGDYDPDESVRDAYCIMVTAKTTTDEILSVVTQKEQDLGHISESKTDVKLLYLGQPLVPGKSFGDYGYERELTRWPRPYAGVLWLSPHHIAPGFAKGKHFPH